MRSRRHGSNSSQLRPFAGAWRADTSGRRAAETAMGLRLGFPEEAGVPPEDIAKVLALDAGVPLVVTLAACDSANQTELTFTNYSLAQELHRLGGSSRRRVPASADDGRVGCDGPRVLQVSARRQ